MKATETLHDRGQSLWLDNITRDLLETGTLARYIGELSVTGLTSNPTIFDHAIKNSSAYDAAIRKKVKEGKSGEELFFELALEDLTRAADLFRPIWDRTRRRGRLGVARGVAAAGPRHRQHAGRRQGPARPGGTTEPPHQDPRHQGRAAGHRGGDLRRHTDQRDAPLLARAIPGGGRRVHAGHRAPHGRRAPARGRLGRLGVHQPMGRGGQGQGAGRRCATSSASRSRSGRTRRTARCSARRAGSASSTPAPARSACCGPARARRTPARPTSSISRRSPRRSR